MQPPLGPVLVLHVVAEDRAAQPVGRLAIRSRDPDLDGAGVGELEERPEAARHERLVDPPVAERRLVVAVEDAGQRLEIEGQEIGRPRHLDPLFHEPVVTEEVPQHVGPVDEGQVVLMDRVGEAVAVAHLTELGLKAVGQREQREVGLGQRDAGVDSGRRLAGLDANLGPSERIDLAEEAQLDLTGKEAVGLASKRAGAGLLDVVRCERADEVAGDAHVEEELTGSTLAVE